jgi:hydroxypyruvate isomerase
MPKFAANISTLYLEMPFLDRIAAAAADGFDAVECQLPYALPAQAITDALRDAGLPLVLFNAPPAGSDAAGIEQAWANGARGIAAIAGREAEFQAGFALALQYAQTLQCPRVHMMAGVLPEGADPAAAREAYVRNLRWAAEQAAQASPGVQVLIEPINGKRDMPGYFLQHQADAHALIEAVGAPNLHLQFDLYHCQIMDGDLAHHLRQAIETGHLGHVQIAGVPSRQEPDLGEVNHAWLLRLLDELAPGAAPGWSGHVGCEYRPARGAVPGGTRDGLGWLHRWREAGRR